jgi:hypothetical protein
MQAAGDALLDCYRELAARDAHLLGEVLPGNGDFEEERHYPADEVRDPVSHAQWYYHAHLDDHPEEHGHFHLFLRRRGMPAGVRPAGGRAGAPSLLDVNAYAHLLAIAVDARGLPIRLLATNRWVTEEVFYPAADVCAMLDRFRLEHASAPLAANRWLPAMLQIFRPQIEWLLHERDAALAAWQAAHPEGDALADQALAIPAELCVDLDAQIAAVERELQARGERALASMNGSARARAAG